MEKTEVIENNEASMRSVTRLVPQRGRAGKLLDRPGGPSHYAEYTDTVVTVRKPIRSYNR